jgi:hypothetical protein
MSSDLENYPAYVAFGVKKIRRIKQLAPLMRNIHECVSDISYCYRLSRNPTEFVAKLKTHNSNNRAMVANNRDVIEEYNRLQAEWREFWAKWKKESDER